MTCGRSVRHPGAASAPAAAARQPPAGREKSAAARPPAARRERPHRRRRAALLAVAAVAALLAIVSAQRGGSASAPAPVGIVPLRVSSGQEIATGFAVAGERVVTVAHVIDGPVTVSGRRARVLRVDPQSDLALLSVASGGAASAGSRAGAGNAAADIADGQRLRVVRLRDGGPSGLSVHVRRSIVAHVRATGASHADVRPALELSARIAPGDSGAPVVTDGGALAGVVFAASINRADSAYAVGASELRKLLRGSSVE